MRLHFKIQNLEMTIPFDHQPQLTGSIHKWLGWNEEHGKMSLYSFSRLEGAKVTKEGLRFQDGASFFFSSYDVKLIQDMIKGIQKDPTMFNGLSISEVIIQDDPDLSDKTHFFLGSPILIKRRNEDRTDHILFDNPQSNIFIKETLQKKMALAGLQDNTLDVRFDTSYLKAGSKKVNYNGIENRCSWCPVFIEGKPETKRFAWNVGLGNSTGIGFGAIK